MDQTHWTLVATTATQFEAEMLRDLLVGEGIASLVQTSDASAYLGVISQCRILVRDGDVHHAAAFIAAWNAADVVPYEPEAGEYDSLDEQ
jgi:hypothetical protein